ncbi:hypothetical protein AMAG_06571 [Allomyces macrogynus ATCC 38327]|uniref:NodB homology domain-containing protein n=1 Tax=Allomyces macrogynus (strain ATCC 38327) TaxID=578462 RepID=A0A0L0SH49_ALLM3|nr:hypothetical protein AMAG_06571 [Allomyces macrogynus ATCC 38327]|eukprot:KNE61772.1 hypothetical protein AMAG_06571 [Allomyces macrogynus ATCC 38327]
MAPRSLHARRSGRGLGLILSLLTALALLSAARGQLVDDFTTTSGTTNKLGLWRGSDDGNLVYSKGQVVVPSNGYFVEVVSPDGKCAVLGGKALQFEFQAPKGTVVRVKSEAFASCNPPNDSQLTEQYVTFLAPTADVAVANVPLAAWNQLDAAKINDFVWEGPVTLRGVSLMPATATTASIGAKSSTAASSATSTVPQSTSTRATSTSSATSTTSAATSTSTRTTSSSTSTGTSTTSSAATSGGAAPTPLFPAPADWNPVGGKPTPSYVTDEFGMYQSCGWPGMFAATYDDGPHPEYTAKILAAAKAAGYRLTFFWIGENVRDNPSVAQSVINAGHHVASHTWSHPSLITLNEDQIIAELDQTEAVIRPYIGGKRPRFMRPPYGDMNAAVMNIIKTKYNYRVVYWSLDSNDWQDTQTVNGISSYYTSEMVNAPASKYSHIALNHDIQLKATQVAASFFKLIRDKGFTQVPMYVCHNDVAYQN